MFQSTITQVVAFSAIAAVLSQMASPARPELPDEGLVTPVVQPVPTELASVNAEPSESAQNNLFAHASTPSVGDMSRPKLPAGLVATASPVAPRTSTAFLPDSPPQNIARKQNLRSGSGSQTKSTFSVPQVAQVKPWFRDGPESSTGKEQMAESDADDAFPHANPCDDPVFKRLADEEYSDEVRRNLESLQRRYNLQPLGSRATDSLLTTNLPYANYDRFSVTIPASRLPEGFDPRRELASWPADMNSVPKPGTSGAARFREANQFETSAEPRGAW